MHYQSQPVELISQKEVFGQTICWIRILATGEFKEVPWEALEQEGEAFSYAHLRYLALAARIREEVARKRVLAPYESSLIPLPHQVLVLEKVMQSGQKRYLLADEVGMGKTIEAGLIMKELKLRGDVKRTLVIVPKSSMLQWQSELKEHFNETFYVYDSQLITTLSRTFGRMEVDEAFNFWTQHHQVIVSTDALKPLERRQGWPRERVDAYNRHRLEAVLQANFDLVVIDEVHKVGGANPTVSRYQMAQALCNAVPHALLLSATPHRGKSDHFRRVLQLLDPEAFDGEGLPEIDELEPYVIRTEKRLAVDYEGNALFNQRHTYRMGVAFDPQRHSLQLALYEAVTDYVSQVFNTAIKTENSSVGLIMVLFQRLTSSSTAAIRSAMAKRLARLEEEGEDVLEEYLADEAEEIQDELPDVEHLHSSELILHFQGALQDEVELLRDLLRQADRCLRNEVDAKATALIDQIERLKQEHDDPDLKILVFTEFRSTQAMLRNLLRSKGYPCEIINGSQDLDERKVALRRFKASSQILIATDAAGESLNMQFCHIVFNYDLPWNPMMIEQRIGRVDRIGQQHPVVAYNMFTDNSVDQRVYEVIEEKLGAILEQMGIDKTADVLDSTLDQKRVNDLYMQSLLDPDKFSYAGERWLAEIREKLREFKATEGLLPQVEAEDINPAKAAEIKHSPLPIWLEEMVGQFSLSRGGRAQKELNGLLKVELGSQKWNFTTEPVDALNDPSIEHLSLQHPWVQELLTSLGYFNSSGGLPVIQALEPDETAGYWSLWEVSARNAQEEKFAYLALFWTGEGRVYSAYANDLWSRFLGERQEFKVISSLGKDQTLEALEREKTLLIPLLRERFEQLATELKEQRARRLANRQRSYEFQVSRVRRIGIENIRESKLRQLAREQEEWLHQFEREQSIVPGSKHLITLCLDVNESH